MAKDWVTEEKEIAKAQSEAIKLYRDLVTNHSQATLLFLHDFMTRWKFGHRRTGPDVITEEKCLSKRPAPFGISRDPENQQSNRT